MDWYHMKEQRRMNRGERRSDQRHDFLAGRRRRSGGVHLVTDKKSGEQTIVAQNGCFGRLAGVNRDVYDQWAQGTRGAY